MEDQQRRDIAIFRYAVIREAADPALTPRQRGALVRQLAAKRHLTCDGRWVGVSRSTLDRWIRAWWAAGWPGLVPAPRPAGPRTDAQVLALAVELKKENPQRTAAHITAILAVSDTGGATPSARTLQRHFARLGFNRRPVTPRRAYGRFEADEVNDLWTGDALHGPKVAGRKTYLFAFIDDRSRALTGYRWGLSEDTMRLEAALRTGLAARGVPKVLYVDNGSAFASKQLTRACAVLGIRLTHSPPGEPAGRGKIERVFATVRGQFLVEIATRGVADLAELNRLFSAWVESVYHRRVHRETGQAPLERFLADGPPPVPTPAQLREAFLWSACRRVNKTAQISLFGNHYDIDAALVGLVVEVVFDPFDLTQLEVRYHDKPVGMAVVSRLTRRVHPAAIAGDQPGEPVRTGIDYLTLIDNDHSAATRQRISYTDLPHDDDQHTDPDHHDGHDDGHDDEVSR